MSSAVRVQVDVPDRPLAGYTPAQLAAMNRAYKEHNRSNGFAAALSSTSLSLKKQPKVQREPKPEVEDTPERKPTVAMEKQLIGCVYGVLLKLGGEIIVTLGEPQKASWAEEKPAVRNKALAQEIVTVVLSRIDNRKDRICKKADLKANTLDVVEKTLAAGNRQPIRSKSLGVVIGDNDGAGVKYQYRIWAKPSTRQPTYRDGRSDKRAERRVIADNERRKRAA